MRHARSYGVGVLRGFGTEGTVHAGEQQRFRKGEEGKEGEAPPSPPPASS